MERYIARKCVDACVYVCFVGKEGRVGEGGGVVVSTHKGRTK